MFPTEQTADHTSLLTRHFNFQCQSLAGYEKNKHGAYVAHMKPQISALGSEIKSLAHFIYRKRRSGTGKRDIMGYKCWEDESRVFIKFRPRLGFDRWMKKTFHEYRSEDSDVALVRGERFDRSSLDQI